MSDVPRNEYPRPQFARSEWMSLNGEWEFSFDVETYDRTITVPFAYQTKRSGIGDTEFHREVWYRRKFCIPSAWREKRILLHLGAIDYSCQIWVDGRHTAEHTGGQTGFAVDITASLSEGAQHTLCIRAVDDPFDLEIPRGKQFWEREPRSIFYTPTTGIWQSVWLEPVSQNHLKHAFITPLLDEKSVKIEYETAGDRNLRLAAEISFQGLPVVVVQERANGGRGAFTVDLERTALPFWNFNEELTWSPETPRLFDVTFHLMSDGREEDTVKSYFGMRKVSVENGVFMLNNRPYFQSLVLDQGYWPDSLMTAPDDEAFARDIMLAKKMGFNGARKHQKVEDPRYLYHADRLGFLVWGEIGSGYRYSRKLVKSLTAEWEDAVLRDYNHPSVVVWTPANESWGIQEVNVNPAEQSFCKTLVHLTKSLDPTRPVVDNDGWEHGGETDLLTVHDYEPRSGTLNVRYAGIDSLLSSPPAGRPLFVKGAGYGGQPVIVSECGGISFDRQHLGGWGYSAVQSESEFLERYREIVSSLLMSPLIQGFCYTQLTDVEQETNGLLTQAREPKANPEAIRKINAGKS